MSPESGLLLMEAVPAITAAIYRNARPQGSETRAELAHDAICQAARMVESCESRGRPVIPGSVAYYAVQASKTGRRFHSNGSSCAMSERAMAQGRSCLVSTVERIAPSSPDGLSFGDVIADPRPDPATAAATNLDWQEVESRLDARTREVVTATAFGEPGRSIAARLKVTPAMIVHLKRKAAAVLQQAWGCAGLEDALIPEPAWRRRVA